LTLAGSLAGSALAADGVLLKDEAGNANDCHMKFPAIRPRTLDTKQPALKSSTTGDVIDFYGSCDESPTGPDQVQAQKLEREHRWETEFDSD
jgi:hypothetical protein